MVFDISSKNEAEISLSCETLEVSRSGYYSWLNRPESERAQFEKSRQTYGSPRITAALKTEGINVNEKRVARIMNEHEIASESVKKFKIKTTDSNHKLAIADRLFETENVDNIIAPNQVWAADVTYIATDEGWLFLAVLLDIFTRKIVGFSSDDNMETNLIMDALEMALGRQNYREGELVSHSDRGSQYASDDYRKKLMLSGIIASMSRKGNCYDNAHCESFFHSLKTELVYRTKFKPRQEAKQAIFEWIEVWYNRQRLHSSLNYMSPEEYEKMALAA